VARSGGGFNASTMMVMITAKTPSEKDPGCSVLVRRRTTRAVALVLGRKGGAISLTGRYWRRRC
jgi:hypothetical protein